MQRTKPPFRADMVGSLLRPEPLKVARARRAAGEITADQLRAVEDSEIEKVLAKQAEVGLQSATDGEFRRSWWHFDFLAGLDGCKLVQLDHGIAFHGVQTKAETVNVIGKVGWPAHHPMIEHFKFLKEHTGLVPKMTIPSPSVLHFRSGFNAIKSIYADIDEFFDDAAAAYGKGGHAPSTTPAAATCSSTTSCGPISAPMSNSNRPERAATMSTACRSATRAPSTRRWNPSLPT